MDEKDRKIFTHKVLKKSNEDDDMECKKQKKNDKGYVLYLF